MSIIINVLLAALHLWISSVAGIYDISITTGGTWGAGTDAQVHVNLTGTLGNYFRVLPQNSSDLFEKHDVDTFPNFVTQDLGYIYELEIGHDKSGGSWNNWELFSVTLTDKKRGKVDILNCSCWIPLTSSSPAARVFNINVNGGWGSWSSYGSCNATCGDGNYWRQRQCDNPPTFHNGTSCPGSHADAKPCFTLAGCAGFFKYRNFFFASNILRSFSQEDARDQCGARGGHLVAVMNERIQDMTLALLAPYLFGSQSCPFYWTDATWVAAGSPYVWATYQREFPFNKMAASPTSTAQTTVVIDPTNPFVWQEKLINQTNRSAQPGCFSCVFKTNEWRLTTANIRKSITNSLYTIGVIGSFRKPTTLACLHMCLIEQACVSFGYVKPNAYAGDNCQLLNSRHHHSLAPSSYTVSGARFYLPDEW